MQGSEPLPSKPTCPSPSELAAFNEGRLTPAAADAIGAHLLNCRRCESDLHRLEEGQDSIARLLRATLAEAPTDSFDQEPEYKRMEAAAKRAGTSSGSEGDTPNTPSPTVPLRLGSYELGEKLGGGGMGTVYRAFHTKLKKWVALKVLRLDRIGDPRAQARFQREMEAVGRLDHPHIVRATDAGEDGGVHFLVMELVEGANLAELVRRLGSLPLAEACELVRQAALGLQAAHTAELVHRDIKPSNLLLSREGQLKILDLGLARVLGGRKAGDELTVSSDMMGTVDYMAPEQWEAGHTVDIRADLYSLGCTLYTLLAGRPPFGGPGFDSPYRKMAGHLRATPPRIRLLRPEVSEGVEGVLARLLAKDPADRFAVPEEVAQALAPFAAGARLEDLFARLDRSGPAEAREALDPAKTHSESSRDTVPTRSAARRNRRRWRVAAAVALVLVIGLMIFLVGQRVVGPPDVPGLVGGVLPDADGWYDLLARPPTEVLWPEMRAYSRWDYDAARRELWVNCNGMGMLQLAVVHEVSFDLEVTIFQNPWVGGVGVYFRERDQPIEDFMHKYSDLLLLERFVREDQESVRLSRGFIRRHPPPRRSNHDVLVHQKVPRPRAGEQQLQITVGPTGLQKYRWDSTPGVELLCDPVPGLEPRPGVDGSVGVFLQSSNARFRSARLRYHSPTGEVP